MGELASLEWISTINAIIDIIEKVYKSVINAKNRKRKQQLPPQETRILLEDVSKLVDNFKCSADFLLLSLSEEIAFEEHLKLKVKNSGKCGFPASQDMTFEFYSYERRQLRAINNCKLFEISSEMRIIVASITKRFHGADFDHCARAIIDYCFSIEEADTHIAGRFKPLFGRPR